MKAGNVIMKYIILLLVLLYYLLFHLWVYSIYKEGSPPFPKCLLYNSKVTAIVGCAGVLAMAFGFELDPDTDIRLKLLYWAGMVMLSVLTVTDLREKRIPNMVLLIMLGVWAVYIVINMFIDFYSALQIAVMSLMGMISDGVVFIIGYYLTRKKLGGGDVKMAAVLGLFFTSEKSFGVLLYGLILCCITSLVLLIAKKIDKDAQIPLCPFILAGAAIMLQIH